MNQKVVPGIALEHHSLKLVGTAVARDPSQSVAIIEDPKTRRQWLLREGDRAGRYRIKKILRDQVIIDAGNGDTSVRMRGYLATGSVSASGMQSNTRSTVTRRTGSRDRHYLIDREQAASAFADPEKVLDQVDITPGRFLNRETGFRITSIEPGSIYTEMGLRSGDLILGINDQEITGPEDAASFFETIGEGGDIDLKVRRRARTYYFHLQIQ